MQCVFVTDIVNELRIPSLSEPSWRPRCRFQSVFAIYTDIRFFAHVNYTNVPCLCDVQCITWHSFEQYRTRWHPEQVFVASVGQKLDFEMLWLAQPRRIKGGGVCGRACMLVMASRWEMLITIRSCLVDEHAAGIPRRGFYSITSSPWNRRPRFVSSL